MTAWRSWLLAFRPKTLTAALVPVIGAAALVFALEGELNTSITVFALAGALFIQIGTNLFNDAIDFSKGADTAERVGPKRVTQSEVFSSKAVMWMGGVSFLLAILCGIPLVIHGGWALVAIGILSLCFGYLYTGGPYPLAYVGLGDLFVILFFGLVAVGGVYFLNVGTISLSAILLGLQIGFLATVLIAINNLRDMLQDRVVNKKTLAVRFGAGFVRTEIVLLFTFTFLLQIYWALLGFYWAALLPLLTLPLVFSLVIKLFKTAPSSLYNGFLARSSMIHLLFAGLFAIGLLVQ